MIAVAFLAAFAVATAAAPAPIEGKWYGGKDAASCKKPQESESAPTLIRKAGFDQHEAHCKWGALTGAGAGVWTAKGSCSVEGSPSKSSFRFTLKGDKLNVKMTDGDLDLTRCPGK